MFNTEEINPNDGLFECKSNECEKEQKKEKVLVASDVCSVQLEVYCRQLMSCAL